jgi:hypothetical protein
MFFLEVDLVLSTGPVGVEEYVLHDLFMLMKYCGTGRGCGPEVMVKGYWGIQTLQQCFWVLV